MTHVEGMTKALGEGCKHSAKYTEDLGGVFFAEVIVHSCSAGVEEKKYTLKMGIKFF